MEVKVGSVVEGIAQASGVKFIGVVKQILEGGRQLEVEIEQVADNLLAYPFKRITELDELVGVA